MAEKTPIPFSEPPWLSGHPSPYYNESHKKWQKAIRPWIQENLHKNALEWDTAELLPESVFKAFAETGMLIPSLPAPLPVEWLKKLGIHDILGVVKVEDFDYLHMAIYSDEVCYAPPGYTRMSGTSGAHNCVDGPNGSSWAFGLFNNGNVLWSSSYP
jgi:acyl-CoA dehydrogenase